MKKQPRRKGSTAANTAARVSSGNCKVTDDTKTQDKEGNTKRNAAASIKWSGEAGGGKAKMAERAISKKQAKKWSANWEKTGRKDGTVRDLRKWGGGLQVCTPKGFTYNLAKENQG